MFDPYGPCIYCPEPAQEPGPSTYAQLPAKIESMDQTRNRLYWYPCSTFDPYGPDYYIPNPPHKPYRVPLPSLEKKPAVESKTQRRNREFWYPGSSFDPYGPITTYPDPPHAAVTARRQKESEVESGEMRAKKGREKIKSDKA